MFDKQSSSVMAALGGMLLVLEIGAAPALAQNVVVNGGFENQFAGAAPPWSFTGDAMAYTDLVPHRGIGDAEIASSFVFTPTNGAASQLVNIPRNGFYRLTYYAADLSLEGGTNFRLTSSLNGRTVKRSTLIGTPLGPENIPYEKFTAVVKETRGSTNLGFKGTVLTTPFDIASLTLDDVSLVFVRGFTANLLLGAQTQNQRAVAGAISAATRSGGSGPLFSALTKVTPTQGPAVLDSLSGEGVTAAQNIAHRSAELFTSTIFDQTTFYGSANTGNAITLSAPQPGFLALARPEQTLAASAQGQPIRELADLPASHIAPVFVEPQRTWRAWATGFGGAEDIRGNAVIGSAHQDNSIFGGSLGVDYQVTPNYLAGIAIGGTDGDFRVADRGTFGSTTGGHIAFYDIATFGAFYGASSDSFSYYSNKSTRFVSGFGGLGGETERGDFDSHEFRTRLEFGRHFDGYGGAITPFVALELADLRSNGFGETAVYGPGLFRLNVSGQSVADVPAFVGARYQSQMAIGNGMVLSPSLQLAYVHEFAPYRSQTSTIADLPGATFLVDGARPSRDAAQVKAGGELQIGPHAAVFADFDGEFSGVDKLYTGKGGVKYTW